jgi:hypothetical protein
MYMNTTYTFLKTNALVVLAVAMPVLLLAGVFIFSYLPNRSVATEYNFLYASCGDRSYYPVTCGAFVRDRYEVSGGVLIVKNAPLADTNADGKVTPEEQYRPRFFVYDMASKISSEVLVADAQRLSLTGLVTSPDGVHIDHGYNRGGGDFFIFGGGSSRYGWYMNRGDAREKIELIDGGTNGYGGDGSLEIISWIQPK